MDWSSSHHVISPVVSGGGGSGNRRWLAAAGKLLVLSGPEPQADEPVLCPGLLRALAGESAPEWDPAWQGPSPSSTFLCPPLHSRCHSVSFCHLQVELTGMVRCLEQSPPLPPPPTPISPGCSLNTT